MKILDRIKLMFVKDGSPDEKRPDDMTSRGSEKLKAESGKGDTCSISDKCCQMPSAESKSCCGDDGDCDCK